MEIGFFRAPPGYGYAYRKVRLKIKAKRPLASLRSFLAAQPRLGDQILGCGRPERKGSPSLNCGFMSLEKNIVPRKSLVKLLNAGTQLLPLVEPTKQRNGEDVSNVPRLDDLPDTWGSCQRFQEFRTCTSRAWERDNDTLDPKDVLVHKQPRPKSASLLWRRSVNAWSAAPTHPRRRGSVGRGSLFSGIVTDGKSKRLKELVIPSLGHTFEPRRNLSVERSVAFPLNPFSDRLSRHTR